MLCRTLLHRNRLTVFDLNIVLDSEEINTEHYEKESLNPQVIYDDSATLSKVQRLSHMVWDLLMFLPTNFSIRNNLETFGHSEVNIIIVTRKLKEHTSALDDITLSEILFI